MGKKSLRVYAQPKYYEIAFGYRDISKEVDCFEKAIEKYSNVTVHNVLEMACGTSPYLEEWNRRGYRYAGLDQSGEMLAYVRKKARAEEIQAKLYRADMIEFSLPGYRADLAYVLLGSLFATSNAQFLQHLDSVSKVLRSGALYLLQGVIWFNILSDNRQQWTITRDRIRIRVSFRAEVVDPVAQTFHDRLIMEVNDAGERKLLTATDLHKFFFPQEFLALVQLHGKFKFLGWFDGFDLKKPVAAKGLQTVVLRKR